jgi:hypothetical protein
MADFYIPPKFRGFVAVLDDGAAILETNNKLDASTGRPRATNWSSVPKERIVSLHMYQEGEPKASLEKEEGMAAEDWIFFHTAEMDLAQGRSTLLSRSIGIRKNGIRHIFRVNEATGEVTAETASA